MTTTLTPPATRRELSHRRSNGIDVTLTWQPAGNALFVTVVEDGGDTFELSVDPHEANDAFDHPYAYAAFRGSALLDVIA